MPQLHRPAEQQITRDNSQIHAKYIRIPIERCQLPVQAQPPASGVAVIDDVIMHQEKRVKELPPTRQIQQCPIANAQPLIANPCPLVRPDAQLRSNALPTLAHIGADHLIQRANTLRVKNAMEHAGQMRFNPPKMRFGEKIQAHIPI